MKAKRRKRLESEGLLPPPAPPPPAQPAYRPITGYRTDLPIPKIKKAWLPRPTKTWKKQRVHKFLMNMGWNDYQTIRRISDQLMIPIAVIIRLSIRRFIRQYHQNEITLDDGSVMTRMTTRRLFTRAEQEILGQLPKGPYKYRLDEEEQALLDEERKRELTEEVKRIEAQKEAHAKAHPPVVRAVPRVIGGGPRPQNLRPLYPKPKPASSTAAPRLMIATRKVDRDE